MTKLGALMIFSFLIFRDFVSNWESPPQIINKSFSGLNKLLITPVIELTTPFKIASSVLIKKFLIDVDGNVEKIYLKVKAAIMADHIIADLGLN